MSESSTVSVELVQRKESIAVTCVRAERSLGTSGTRFCEVDGILRKLQSKGKRPVFASEAGRPSDNEPPLSTLPAPDTSLPRAPHAGG